MNIAFATIYDARDVRRGSGTYYHLCQELERQGHTVHYLGPLDVAFPFPTRIARYLSTRLLKGKYRSYQDPFTARKLGQEVENKLEKVDYDLLLTNDYSIAGYTQVSKPLVLYTDAMFNRRYEDNINPRLAGLSGMSVRFCIQITKQGLQRADYCVFPSEWIVDEAVNNYQIPREKISVVRFGANIEDPGSEVTQARKRTLFSDQKVKLLFVGKDWGRKGGAVAVETATLLNERGIPAELHVVGSKPAHLSASDTIHLHGLLDKTVPAEKEKLHHLYATSDVFILPSKAEGFVISVLEAAAYGLPVVAYDTDGVREPVQDGITGVLLPLSSKAEAFSDVVASWCNSPEDYHRLSEGARTHFERTVNWKRTVSDLIAEIQLKVL